MLDDENFFVFILYNEKQTSQKASKMANQSTKKEEESIINPKTKADGNLNLQKTESEPIHSTFFQSPFPLSHPQQIHLREEITIDASSQEKAKLQL